MPVHLLGYVSDALVRALFQRALAFVFPPVEDFGIVPVEAMAAGCPVIVNRVGGAAESVIDGMTGFQVDPDDMQEVPQPWSASAPWIPRPRGRAPAHFDIERFIAEVRDWVAEGVGAKAVQRSTSAAA